MVVICLIFAVHIMRCSALLQLSNKLARWMCVCQYTNATFYPLFYCSKSRTIEATTKMEREKKTTTRTYNFTVNNCNLQSKKAHTQCIRITSHAYHTDTRSYNRTNNIFFASTIFIIYGNVMLFHQCRWLTQCPLSECNVCNVYADWTETEKCRDWRGEWSDIERGARGRTELKVVF